MLKKVAVSLILFFSVGLFFGCVNVDTSVRLLSNGQVVQRVDVVFDKESVRLAGFNDFNLFVQKVQGVVKELLDLRQSKYASDLGQLFENGRISEEGLEILSKAGKDNITAITNGIRIEKGFDNLNAFLYYNYRSFGEKGHLADVPLEYSKDMTTEEKLFIVNYIEKCYTLYHGQEDFVEGILSALGNELGSDFTSFSMTDANLTFRFITPFRRLHSNGEISHDGNYYVHSWNVKNPDNTITISRTVANSGIWYVVVLLAALFGTVFVALIFVAYDKTHKKKTSTRELAEMLDKINESFSRSNTGNTQGIHMADVIQAAKASEGVPKSFDNSVIHKPPDKQNDTSFLEGQSHKKVDLSHPFENLDVKNAPKSQIKEGGSLGSSNNVGAGMFAFNVSQFLKEVSEGKEKSESIKEKPADGAQKQPGSTKPKEKETKDGSGSKPPLSPTELENMLKEINSPRNRLKKEKEKKDDK